MTALATHILAVILSALLTWGAFEYIEHRGAKECYAAGEKQQTHNAAAEATEKSQDTKAEQTLEQTPTVDPGSLPALPASLHASCPRIVPKARPATSQGDYTPDVRATGATGLVPPSWLEFQRSDVQRARDADSEVIYLQSLLDDRQKLCSGG